MHTNKFKVIDLFCGCGGLSLGFSKAGFDVVLGIDMWKDALITYSHNLSASKTICEDIRNLDLSEVHKIIHNSNIDVIIGGPPCQGFSLAGKRQVEDDRNGLYREFVNFVNYFKPKAFVMENVPNILSIGEGKVKENILSDFSSLGYKVSCKVLLASDYGVPQNRKRAFFVGLRNGKDFEFPQIIENEKVTSSQALSDLPEDSMQDGSQYLSETSSEYQVLMRRDSLGVYNHQTTQHNSQTQEIIALVPDGGNYKDLPTELQSTRKVHIAWTRLNSKKPSFTIDCGHRHHFHYKWNRVPTVRECARIQSFPDKFIFYQSRTSQYKQVGNAVPPLLAESIAKQLMQYL